MAWSGRRALVTGAAGFIGSHVLRRLVAEGATVVALVRPSSNLWRLHDRHPQVELVYADLGHLTAESIAQIARQVGPIHTLFHLASAGIQPTQQDAEILLQTNVTGTLHMLHLAHALQVERFVLTGSCFEYGPGQGIHEDCVLAPTSEYGASKAAAGILAHAFSRRSGLPVVTLRPFTVYGPYEAGARLIPHVIVQALAGRDIALTGGAQGRDFILVDDVVSALLRAALSPEAVGQTVNICSGQETLVRDVVSLLVAHIGGTARPRFGALPYRDSDVWHQSGDPTRARTILGWQAQTPLEEGLRRTVAWFREHRLWYSQ